jgi:hypothetical protein
MAIYTETSRVETFRGLRCNFVCGDGNGNKVKGGGRAPPTLASLLFLGRSLQQLNFEWYRQKLLAGK